MEYRNPVGSDEKIANVQDRRPAHSGQELHRDTITLAGRLTAKKGGSSRSHHCEDDGYGEKYIVDDATVPEVTFELVHTIALGLGLIPFVLGTPCHYRPRTLGRKEIKPDHGI